MLHSNDLDRAFVAQVLRGLCSSWLLAHTRIVFPHAISSSLIWLGEVLLELGGRCLCWLEEFRRPRLQKFFLNRNFVLAPLEVLKHGHVLECLYSQILLWIRQNFTFLLLFAFYWQRLEDSRR